MRWRARKFFAKALEPSSCAAFWVGPKQRRPAARKESTTPFTSGISGPTIVRSTSCAFAKAVNFSTASTAMATFSTLGSRAVPALPGATYTLSTRGDCAVFQARACSRPPLPMINTFMTASIGSVRVAKDTARPRCCLELHRRPRARITVKWQPSERLDYACDARGSEQGRTVGWCSLCAACGAGAHCRPAARRRAPLLLRRRRERLAPSYPRLRAGALCRCLPRRGSAVLRRTRTSGIRLDGGARRRSGSDTHGSDRCGRGGHRRARRTAIARRRADPHAARADDLSEHGRVEAQHRRRLSVVRTPSGWLLARGL